MSLARPEYKISKRYQAKSCDERIKFLVLHYTAGNFGTSLDQLTNGDVSAHYLVPAASVDSEENAIYSLVDENRRAWHAGVSSWGKRSGLNDTSIGIEIVNTGYTEDASGKRTWEPFTDYQIQLVQALSQDIIKRYGIEPTCVIGHNDIAPGRKPDPGPLFPWEQFAKNGVGAWPDADVVAEIHGKLDSVTDVSALQTDLKKYGYGIQVTGELDQQTKDVIAAFNRHFLATDSNEPTLAMRATLAALIVKYFPAMKLVHEAKTDVEEDGFVMVSLADTELVPTIFKKLNINVQAATNKNNVDTSLSLSPR